MRRACLALALVGCSVDKGVTAFNSTPEATITSPQPGDEVMEGELIILRGAGSDANHSADELLATWFVEGEVLCPAQPPGEDGSTVCELEASPDRTQILLEVKDPQNATGAATLSLAVLPTEAPQAEITSPAEDGGPYYEGHPVELAGQVWDAEDASDDLLASWTSDIGGTLLPAQSPASDGSYGGSAALDQGLHTLTLRVEDSTGKTGGDSVTIEVGPPNQAPDCLLTAPASGSVGLEGDLLILSGHATDPDIASGELAVEWASDLDGVIGASVPDSSGAAELEYSSLSPGTHLLTMTAADEIGASCTAEATYTVGNPPTVEISSPADGSLVNEGESAAFTAAVSDDADSPDQLALLWASSLQGILSTDSADPAGQSSFSAVLAAGTHTITVVATDSLGYEASDSMQLVVNGLPSAPAVSVSPSPAYTTEDLLASASGSTDPEGDLVAYTYEWRKNGMPTGHVSAVLPYTETSKGETWTVVATPDDGNGPGPTAEAGTDIVNTPPMVASISISPSQTYNDGTLTCSATASDPDETAAVTYQWTVDGADAGSSASLDLALTGALPGSVATCVATAEDSDGETADGTASITVSNRAPVVAITGPVDGHGENEGAGLELAGTVYDSDSAAALQITWTSSIDGELWAENATGAVSASANLSQGTHTLTLAAQDSMGLTGTDSVQVVINGLPSIPDLVLQPSPEASTTDDLVAAASGSTDPEGSAVTYSYVWLRNGLPTSSTGSVLPHAETQNGDVWTVQASASDGSGTGEPAEASTAIVNSAPSMLSVEITPSPGYAGDTIECVAEAADPDGAPELSYAWTLDGAAAGTSETLELAPPAAPGSVAVCTATATDDEGETDSAQATLTVSNRAPFIDGIETGPASASIASEITCLAHVSDPDGEEPSTSYEWHGSSGLLAASSSLQLDSGMASPGETLTCHVLATDGGGLSASGSADLTLLSNIPPVASGDSYELRGGCLLSVDASEGLLANDTDADGDALTLSLLQGPADGALSLEADGSFSYEPDGSGDAYFTYQVSDGNGGTSEASVVLSGLDGAITVDTEEDSLAEDGLCSLREAVLAANSDAGVDGCAAGSGADAIVFAAQEMEILLSMEGAGEDSGLTGDLDILSELSILGCPSAVSQDSAPGTVVDGGATVSWQENCDEDGLCATIPLTIYSDSLAEFDRHLDVHDGAVLYLEDVHLRGGGVKYEHGSSLYNAGEAYLEDTWLTDSGTKGGSGTRGMYGNGNPNTGQGGGGGGGGGAGFGGAVYNAPGAYLSLVQDDGSCMLYGNAAIGGDGARGGHHANGGANMTSSTMTYGGDGGGPEGGTGAAGSSCNAEEGGFGSGGAGGQLNCIGGAGGFGGGGGGGGANNGGHVSGGAGGPAGFGGGDGGQEACSASAGGGAGAGMGGAVFNDQGTVSVSGCAFEDNKTIGGKRGSNYYGCSTAPMYGDGIGGALFNYMGTVEIEDSSFSGNEALGGRSDTAATPGSGGDGYGGALFSYQGTMTETGSQHSGNAADTDGADYDEEP